MRILGLFLCFFPLFIWSFNFDTIQNKLIIENNNTALFSIPIHTINAEVSKSKLEIKLGSVKYKSSARNKQHPKISYFSKTAISLTDGEYQITFLINSKGTLSIHSTSRHTFFAFENLKDEKFYGGGMQFSHPLLNGHQIVNICEENGIGRGDAPISKWTSLLGVKGVEYSSYYPIPFVISNKNRGIFIDSPTLSSMEFHSDHTDLSITGEKVELQLYDAENMISIIQRFNQQNGRGNFIPDWALGSIIGVQGGTEEVKNKISPLLEKEIPVQGIWIQDWVGKRETKIGSRLNWVWQLDTSYTGIFDYAAEHQLKVLGYINPFFAENGKYTNKGLQEGFFVKETEAAKIFDFGGMKGYMLDVFNPQARKWMKDIITTNLVNNGFDGWMADFAEWYPIVSAEDIERHNSFTHEWVMLNHEIQEETERELFIFHRSGNVGTAQYSQSTWCGDQMTNYGLNDGLPSAINAMISSGMTGLPPTHSDIGGYTSVKKPILKNILRSEDLLKDWIKLEAFTPFFRSHEGLLPDEDLQVYSNEEIISYYDKYANIHHVLIGYFSETIEAYQETGIPVFRHPILVDEADVPYSFYVGDHIYIQFAFKSPRLPKGFSFLPSDEKHSNVYIALREGSNVAELVEAQLK